MAEERAFEDRLLALAGIPPRNGTAPDLEGMEASEDEMELTGARALHASGTPPQASERKRSAPCDRARGMMRRQLTAEALPD